MSIHNSTIIAPNSYYIPLFSHIMDYTPPGAPFV